MAQNEKDPEVTPEERDAFWKFAEKTAQVVETWPEWKRGEVDGKPEPQKKAAKTPPKR